VVDDKLCEQIANSPSGYSGQHSHAQLSRGAHSGLACGGDGSIEPFNSRGRFPQESLTLCREARARTVALE